MNMIDCLPSDHGFESEMEFIKLVAAVDLTVPGMRERFKDWQHNDGTKAGLLRLEAKKS